MKYPFMFVPIDEVAGKPTGKVWIVIAHYSMSFYSSAWMVDEELGNDCVVPDVDLIEEKHSFDTELEGLRFIKEWWARQNI